MDNMNNENDARAPRFLISVLTGCERDGWVTPEIMRFVDSVARDKRYATNLALAHGFRPAAAARNKFCAAGVRSGADWLVMIDNDMAPDVNLLECVRDAPADADIVVPRYYMWEGTPGKTRLCWGLLDPDVNDRGEAKIGMGFHELTKAGTGVMFIRPRVFETLPEPWFYYTYAPDGQQIATEDVMFCLKAREHGFRVFGNGAVEVSHYHTADISKIAALQYAPHA